MSAQLRPGTRINPGNGTLAALNFVCPHCLSAQGVRCITPSGEPLKYVHNKRMNLASAKAKGGAA